MAKSTVPLVATGDWIDAAWLNQYLRDNVAALWPYTTAGDISYATSPTVLARLGKPSVESVLKNTSAGAPSWLSLASIDGRVHASGMITDTTNRTTSSATFANVTGVTFNLVLTQICTIYAFAYGNYGVDDYANVPTFGISINGVDDASPISSMIPAGLTEPLFVTMTKASGIAAGTRAIQLRFRIPSGIDLVNIRQCRMIAFAVVD